MLWDNKVHSQIHPWHWFWENSINSVVIITISGLLIKIEFKQNFPHTVDLQDPGVAEGGHAHHDLIPGHPGLDVVGDGVVQVEPVIISLS